MLSLVLKDFTSHKNSTINLDVGLTSLIGENDTGKSSIINAVSWLLTDKPKGTTMIRTGAPRCSVSINGVSKMKDTDAKTVYTVNGTKFYKAEPPAEIQNLLDLKTLYDLSVNIINQHDGLFLLQESGATIAKIIGDLTETESLDLVLSGINQDKLTVKKDITVLQERVQDLAAEIDIADYWSEIYRKYKLMKELQYLSTNITEILECEKKLKEKKKSVYKLLILCYNMLLTKITSSLGLTYTAKTKHNLVILYTSELIFTQLQSKIQQNKVVQTKLKYVTTQSAKLLMLYVYKSASIVTSNTEKRSTLSLRIGKLNTGIQKLELLYKVKPLRVAIGKITAEMSKQKDELLHYDSKLKEQKYCPTCNRPL